MSDLIDRLNRENFEELKELFQLNELISLNYNWYFKEKEVAFVDIQIGSAKYRTSLTLPVFHDNKEAKMYLANEAQCLIEFVKQIIPDHELDIKGTYCIGRNNQKSYGSLLEV